MSKREQASDQECTAAARGQEAEGSSRPERAWSVSNKAAKYKETGHKRTFAGGLKQGLNLRPHTDDIG